MLIIDDIDIIGIIAPLSYFSILINGSQRKLFSNQAKYEGGLCLDQLFVACWIKTRTVVNQKDLQLFACHALAMTKWW
jgi:hypothetical protein